MNGTLGELSCRRAAEQARFSAAFVVRSILRNELLVSAEGWDALAQRARRWNVEPAE